MPSDDTIGITTADGVVVTDPEQRVWFVLGSDSVGACKLKNLHPKNVPWRKSWSNQESAWSEIDAQGGQADGK